MNASMLSNRFVRFFRHLNWITLKKTIARVAKRRLPGLSSEIAYNAMLSLFPAIIAVLTAIGLLGSALQPTFQDIADRLGKVAPEEAIVLIRDFAKQITHTQNT